MVYCCHALAGPANCYFGILRSKIGGFPSKTKGINHQEFVQQKQNKETPLHHLWINVTFPEVTDRKGSGQSACEKTKNWKESSQLDC